MCSQLEEEHDVSNPALVCCITVAWCLRVQCMEAFVKRLPLCSYRGVRQGWKLLAATRHGLRTLRPRRATGDQRQHTVFNTIESVDLLCKPSACTICTCMSSPQQLQTLRHAQVDTAARLRRLLHWGRTLPDTYFPMKTKNRTTSTH